MSRSATHCDVVTLIEPCDGGWDVRVVWWRMTDGKWVASQTPTRESGGRRRA
jgi:hypothetical protein